MTKTPPTRRRQPPRYPFEAFEPALRDVLDDPVVRALMARDGVGLGDIRYLVDLVNRRPSAAAPQADEPPVLLGLCRGLPSPSAFGGGARPHSMAAGRRASHRVPSTGSPALIRA